MWENKTGNFLAFLLKNQYFRNFMMYIFLPFSLLFSPLEIAFRTVIRHSHTHRLLHVGFPQGKSKKKCIFVFFFERRSKEFLREHQPGCKEIKCIRSQPSRIQKDFSISSLIFSLCILLALLKYKTEFASDLRPRFKLLETQILSKMWKVNSTKVLTLDGALDLCHLF